jgi:hypothetical protein
MFRWRDRTYLVIAILEHWREDAAYWTTSGIEVPQRDLWRVEAIGPGGIGIYELAHELGRWLLYRVWD